MEESNNNLVSVTMDGNEQNIYGNHLEMPKSYSFDQGTNLSELETGTDFCEINFGLGGEFKENKDPLMSEKEIEGLTDPTQIDPHFFDVSEVTKEMMNSLQEAVDFDESLMPQLEADFAMFTEGSPQPVEDSVQLQMDIRDPLSNMKHKIGKILQKSLDDYTICLQGSQSLEGHKNLVDQCIQGEGMVQINVQVQHDDKQINIIDVLKPAEDFAKSPTENEPEKVSVEQQDFEEEELLASKKNIVQWQVDAHFKKEQERLKIPFDPTEWNDLHVRYWVQWAVRQFNLTQLKLSDWTMNGAQLHELSLADFQRIVPNDPGDVFWTHLELLRQMKLVAVIREKESKDAMKPSSKLAQQAKISRIIPNYSSAGRYFESAGNKTGFNNQIQLWQFLLDLLTSRQHKNIIHWLVGTDGEFKLANPEKVAELWGERKNKPSMNYEKLSRGLRYYYQGDMISKVHGKRFTYKFVCDLKQLVGYSAIELANLVEFGTPKPGY